MALRIPPHDVLSERSLLGALMVRSGSFLDIAGLVDTQDFYDPKNQIVFGAMKSLASKNQPIDLVTVVNELKSNGNLDEVGGPSYLSESAGNIGMSWNAEYYAKIISEKSTLRKLIRTGDEVAELGFNESEDVNKLIESAGSKVLAISASNEKEDVNIGSAVREFDKMQDEFKQKQFEAADSIIGIPCGFSKIDKVIDGLRPGHFWVVSAYTSGGKTWFALNIINEILTHTGVAFFSLEMSKVDIVSRLLAVETKIGATKILRHDLGDEASVDTFMKARKRLNEGKLRIYSQTGSLDGIIMAMTKEMLRNKTQVFVIDYIQLIKTRSKNEYEQVTEAAQRLQSFAKETGCTIIVLSQVNNEHARDPNQEVHGTKGGGSLPASVDLAIELFNEDKKEERDNKVARGEALSVKAIIKKNRHGRTGHVELDFTPWNGKFVESDWF